jgi:hypothetical protein
MSQEHTMPDLTGLDAARDYDAGMRFSAPDAVLDLSLTALGHV